MATKHTKKTSSPRKGGARKSSGSRKSRLPESRQSEAEPEVLEENERRIGRDEGHDVTVSEPVEEGAPVDERERSTTAVDEKIGQKERDADLDAEVEPEEDWGGGPSPNPPTA